MSDQEAEAPDGTADGEVAPGAGGATAGAEVPRRRHRRAVRPADGAVAPQPGDQSSDDTAAGWAEAPASTSRDDEWYLRERPPHWG